MKYLKLPKICTIDNCDRPGKAKLMCERHYKQVRKHGHILSGNYLSEQGKKANAARKNTHRPWSEEAKLRNAGKRKGRNWNTGRTHFKKGHTPWCKGLKGWPSDQHRDAISRANRNNQYSVGKSRNDIKGEKNPMWRGGKRSTSDKERVKFRKQTQMLVFQRDNYTCQICDQYSGYIQVDHIKSWAKYPELRFDLNNCRTLCMACHYYITFKRKLPKGVVWGHNFSRRITK